MNLNFSTSVSFQVGSSNTVQSWNLTVSLAEIPAQGENATAAPDPRVLLTLYDLHPPENWTRPLDSGLPEPILYDDENEPATFQLARRLTYWPFDTSATNSYNGQGDCEEVVEPECIRQLEDQNGTALTGDFSACPSLSSRWGSRGVGTYAEGQPSMDRIVQTFARDKVHADSLSLIRLVQFVQRLYLEDPSSYWLGGFISGVYSAGNRTLIERELNRVHLAFISGTENKALCLRFRDNEVNSSNPGTGPAPSSGAKSVQTALCIAMVPTVLCLFL
ncbi:hypothetical protein D0862_02310 [Hortaea werneckii]|uniref:Uncharacterized protein n=1 Tax=Hortaea werneckii TaxID=91943 RepID=A0A3M7HJN4_HORWE|nr:hypothetical protein D0862_02310 [Hortaea werneckii]